MSEIETFLEEYNDLVIGDVKTSHYQIIHTNTEEPWGTISAPCEPQLMNEKVSNISSQLASGRQHIRIQAIGSDNAVRGQLGINVEGRSPNARQSGSELVTAAKATAMNVQTAETQLINMAARLEAADKRAQEAEERAGNMTGDVFKMGDLVNRMLMEKESAILDREEREERMRNMQQITATLTPILGQAIVIGSKFLEHKIKVWESNWEKESQEKINKNKEKENGSPESPS